MAPFLIGCAALAPGAAGAPLEPLYGAVHREKPAAIETLQQLVGIESGSRDKEGLDRIAALLRERLAALDGNVEVVDPGQDAVKLFDTPPQIGRIVVDRFERSGARKILLLAHMDTVYPRGTLARHHIRTEGHDTERDPRYRDSERRRARQAGRRFRRHRARLPRGCFAKPSRSRHQGGGHLRAPAATARGDRSFARARTEGASRLRGAGQGAGRRRFEQGRRHRCRVRGALRRAGGRGEFRPAGIQLPLVGGGVRRARFDRAAALPPGEDDHGGVAGVTLRRMGRWDWLADQKPQELREYALGMAADESAAELRTFPPRIDEWLVAAVREK